MPHVARGHEYCCAGVSMNCGHDLNGLAVQKHKLDLMRAHWSWQEERRDL